MTGAVIFAEFMSFSPKSQLPRLLPEWYRGEAYVFWTYTVEDRGTGWLTPTFHAGFREVLLHASARYDLAVPAYCLMPDHAHWIGIGLSRHSDQRRASAFLRKFLTPHLRPFTWQRQPHDHVLREAEREHGAFRLRAVMYWKIRYGPGWWKALLSGVLVARLCSGCHGSRRFRKIIGKRFGAW